LYSLFLPNTDKKAITLISKIVFLCILLLLHFVCDTKGQSFTNFSFLTQPYEARSAGLGGLVLNADSLSWQGYLQNPAAIKQLSTNRAAFHYNPYFAGIQYFTAQYLHFTQKQSSFGAAVQYLNYGSIKGTDPTGLATGNFQASDYALTLSYSRKVNAFRMGLNLKFVGSQIEQYQSTAIALDMGVAFQHPVKDFSVALVIKNLGFSLQSYTGTERLSLPFDVQIGTSFKPTFMPLRFHFTLQKLTDWNFKDLQGQQGKSNQNIQDIGTVDKIARHLVFGTELLIHRNFQLRFGYNHLKNRELRPEGGSNFSGFSFGFLLRIKRIEFQYALASYHPVQPLNYISLLFNWNQDLRVKK
jgi:hypothetical protein